MILVIFFAIYANALSVMFEFFNMVPILKIGNGIDIDMIKEFHSSGDESKDLKLSNHGNVIIYHGYEFHI
jgi:hypothetical protein